MKRNTLPRLVCISAGNDAPAVDITKEPVNLASNFSSRGKVDVTCIGKNLVLLYYDSYYYTSGTSLSCPPTSGVFTIISEAFGSQIHSGN